VISGDFLDCCRCSGPVQLLGPCEIDDVEPNLGDFRRASIITSMVRGVWAVFCGGIQAWDRAAINFSDLSGNRIFGRIRRAVKHIE